MIKNASGQHVAFQAISVSTGAAVTSGTPTVYYTLDGGTQAECAATAVHEGNGCWTVDLAQAETNGSHIAYTFVLAGAVTQTVNLYTLTAAAGSGAGADNVTITWTAGGNPVADADVWITSDPNGATVVAGTLQTNASGQATFLLDAGVTYYLWGERSGVNSLKGRRFVAVAD